MDLCCVSATSCHANRGNVAPSIHKFYVKNTTKSWAFLSKIVFYGGFQY